MIRMNLHDSALEGVTVGTVRVDIRHQADPDGAIHRSHYAASPVTLRTLYGFVTANTGRIDV